MLRPIYRFLIFGAVLAGVLLVSGPQADAFWWRCCPPVSCGYSPCYTPCWSSCDPCFGSSWAVGWRPGPVRRLLFGRYRWYPAWGSYGCCDSYTWEPCCSEVAMAPATPAAPMPPQDQRPTLAPKTSPAPTPAKPLGDEELNKLMRPPESPATPKKATNPSTGDQTGRKDSGLLSLNVPDAARVLINGRETRSVGDRREFVSHGLKEGKVYPYTIRALVQAKGSDAASVDGSRWVWITKTVYLRAGDQIRVTFSDNLDLERQLAQVEPASIR